MAQAVMDGQEHEYFNEPVAKGDAAEAAGAGEMAGEGAGPPTRDKAQAAAAGSKAGPKAGPETQVMTEMDGMRRVYRSVLLSSFLQKLVLVFKANY